jgi:peroxiredoxin Q/BCP
MPKRPLPGDPAPDFELEGTDGPFRLGDLRGERVILLFYPADNSTVCTRQFCSYRDQVERFGQLGARAVGISAQDLDSHRRFIAQHGLTLPLLSDPEHSVAKAYSAHSAIIGTKRATFIVDEEGTVRYRHDNLLSLGYDSAAELGRALEALSR